MMSNIFDALQRSEKEQVGSELSRPAKATELLQRAEHRAVSNWEATVVDVESEATSFADSNEVVGRGTILLAEALAAASGNAEGLSADGRSDILSRFQSLPISLPAHNRLVCLTDKENPTAEAIRLLAVRLRDLRRIRPLKKVLITSTIPQEGKSTIAANLACALAQASNEKTLLVEGDLRRPSLSQMFGIQKSHGIYDLLSGELDPLADIYHLEEGGFWLLPAGDATGNPIELLQSQKLQAVMQRFARWFDWIIIDSPPVLPLADTSIWMRLADGVLLVTRQGTTEKQQLQRGLVALDSTKLLGALVNGSMASAYSGYYYRSSSVS
jgi:capsular exopolysaccharide synthesis family protein